MDAADPQAAVKDLEEAAQELLAELDRLTLNMQALTQYQVSVLQVTKVLCSWMDNIEKLSKHRKCLPLTSDPAD
ncbi:hypothetical protein FKM82_020035 [Ascaphus truei]